MRRVDNDDGRRVGRRLAPRLLAVLVLLLGGAFAMQDAKAQSSAADLVAASPYYILVNSVMFELIIATQGGGTLDLHMTEDPYGSPNYLGAQFADDTSGYYTGGPNSELTWTGSNSILLECHIGTPGADTMVWFGHDGAFFFGMDGDDDITGALNSYNANVIFGGDGDDDIVTGDGVDIIFTGFPGKTYTSGTSNVVSAGDEDDIVMGSDIADVIDGGDGDDWIQGRGGADTIYGGDGQDHIEGGTGADLIDGEDGDDGFGSLTTNPAYIHGFGANSTIPFGLFGGSEGDTIRGGTGDDEIEGGGGFNTLLGQSGDDWILGGHDGNWIEGGHGDDECYGGDGVDDIDGDDAAYASSPNGVTGMSGQTPAQGYGYDHIEGGGETDLLHLGFSVYSSTLYEFAHGDTYVSPNTQGNADGNDVIFGGEGSSFTIPHSVLKGGGGNDTITCSPFGTNVISGNAGMDDLFGGPYSDFILGGTGDDLIRGGAGDDICIGEDGDDAIDGGGATLTSSTVVPGMTTSKTWMGPMETSSTGKMTMTSCSR